jgi:hypothetical protein
MLWNIFLTVVPTKHQTHVMWTVLSLLFNSTSLVLFRALCLCNLAAKITKVHKVVQHTFCNVSWQEWHISSTERYITVHFQEDMLGIALVEHIAPNHLYKHFEISSNGSGTFCFFPASITHFSWSNPVAINTFTVTQTLQLRQYL